MHHHHHHHHLHQKAMENITPWIGFEDNKEWKKGGNLRRNEMKKAWWDGDMRPDEPRGRVWLDKSYGSIVETVCICVCVCIGDSWILRIFRISISNLYNFWSVDWIVLISQEHIFTFSLSLSLYLYLFSTYIGVLCCPVSLSIFLLSLSSPPRFSHTPQYPNSFPFICPCSIYRFGYQRFDFYYFLICFSVWWVALMLRDILLVSNFVEFQLNPLCFCTHFDFRVFLAWCGFKCWWSHGYDRWEFFGGHVLFVLRWFGIFVRILSFMGWCSWSCFRLLSSFSSNVVYIEHKCYAFLICLSDSDSDHPSCFRGF